MHPGLPRGDVQVDATQVCIALPLDHAAGRHNSQASGGGGGEGGKGSSPGATAGLAGVAGSAPAVTMQQMQQQMQQQQRPPLPQQQVFAFLPLRSYGLRLVVQVRGSRRGEGRTRGKGGSSGV